MVFLMFFVCLFFCLGFGSGSRWVSVLVLRVSVLVLDFGLNCHRASVLVLGVDFNCHWVSVPVGPQAGLRFLQALQIGTPGTSFDLPLARFYVFSR